MGTFLKSGYFLLMHGLSSVKNHYVITVEFSHLGTNVEVCVVVVECLVVLGFVFSVAASGATLLEGDSRKGFSVGVRLD